MGELAFVIVLHQIVFQAMFLAKNIMLRRRLAMPIRGGNREAKLSIGFFGLFILCSVLLGLVDAPFGSIELLERGSALVIALALLAVNIVVVQEQEPVRLRVSFDPLRSQR